MDGWTPGFHIHHQLLELTQTPVHWVSDAIQPSNTLSSPSLPAFNLSQHQGLFQWKVFSVSCGQSIRASVSTSMLTMNIQEWFPLGWTGWIYLQSKGLYAAAAAAKLFQSCPTLCDPIDGSPPGSPIPGILKARTLEWVAISFSKAWKWKVKVKTFSRVRLLVTPWTAAYQALPSMGFSRQKYWNRVPLP